MADETNDASVQEAFAFYARVRAKAKHIEVKPGELLPLKGVHGVVVSSDGKMAGERKTALISPMLLQNTTRLLGLSQGSGFIANPN